MSLENKKIQLSVVIPVFKAEGCMDELYRRVSRACEEISRDFEIILVDDASPDGSWKLIQEMASKDIRVRGIQFTRNFGQHHAISAGLWVTRGEWVVVMDCDLQDRPEDIPLLYQRAQEGFDCVLARRNRQGDPWPKRLSAWAFYKFFNYLTNLNYDGSVGNFSIISRRTVESLNQIKESVRFYGGFLRYLGYPHTFIDVIHDDRFQGKSSYSFLKLIKVGGDLVLAYSNKPLRLCVFAGFFISTLSFLAALYYLLIVIFLGSPVMGWPTLVITIFFSTGTIVFTLGLLGLYIGKIFTEVKGRPLYVVNEQTFEYGTSWKIG